MTTKQTNVEVNVVGGGGGSKEESNVEVNHTSNKLPEKVHNVGGGGASKEESTNVELVSSDGVKFYVSHEAAKLSGLIRNTLGFNGSVEDDADGSDSDNEDDVQTVPLEKTESKYLGDVVEFMNYYHTNPMPEVEKPLDTAEKFVEKLGDDFYRNYTKKDMDYVFEMVKIANFMDIPPLLDLMCATVASALKGKTPEEIQKTFGIEADFTPEDEEKTVEENPWLEEL